MPVIITTSQFQLDILSVSSTKRQLNRIQSLANVFCKGSDRNRLGFVDQETELRIFVLNLYLDICSSLIVYLLGLPGFSCGMQNLVPEAGIEPGLPALGTQGLNHWTARGVPKLGILCGYLRKGENKFSVNELQNIITILDHNFFSM